jgi:alanine racemase
VQPQVRLTGSFTHFSDADGDEGGMDWTEVQFARFLKLTEGLQGIRHCANSAVIHRRPDMALDMVRAGISLYGYPPVTENNIGLEPCMRWTARISYIKETEAGAYLSYGRTFRTGGKTRVATVTCGYGDGYHRCAGPKAEVLIHGKRAKVLGRICMDQMLADVSDIPEAREGDEVVLIGEDGNDRIDAEQIAAWSGTISYEILLSVGSRVERVFEDRQNYEGGRNG